MDTHHSRGAANGKSACYACLAHSCLYSENKVREPVKYELFDSLDGSRNGRSIRIQSASV